MDIADVLRIKNENASLRTQLKIMLDGASAADELIQMLRGIAEHTANSKEVSPKGQDASRQIIAKIDDYYSRFS